MGDKDSYRDTQKAAGTFHCHFSGPIEDSTITEDYNESGTSLTYTDTSLRKATESTATSDALSRTTGYCPTITTAKRTLEPVRKNIWDSLGGRFLIVSHTVLIWHRAIVTYSCVWKMADNTAF